MKKQLLCAVALLCAGAQSQSAAPRQAYSDPSRISRIVDQENIGNNPENRYNQPRRTEPRVYLWGTEKHMPHEAHHIKQDKPNDP